MSTAFEPLSFEPGYRRVASAIAGRILDRSLRELLSLTPRELLQQRYEKFRRVGEFAGDV